VVSYDLRSIWDSADNWIGLGMQAHTNTTEIGFELQFLWLNDIDPEVLIGRPSMGGLFTLADHSCTDLVWPFSADGHTGHCTDTVGTLSYAKIQRAVDTGAKVKFMKDADIKRFPRARPEDIVQ